MNPNELTLTEEVIIHFPSFSKVAHQLSSGEFYVGYYKGFGEIGGKSFAIKADYILRNEGLPSQERVYDLYFTGDDSRFGVRVTFDCPIIFWRDEETGDIWARDNVSERRLWCFPTFIRPLSKKKEVITYEPIGP